MDNRKHVLAERAKAENTTPIALVIEAVKQAGDQYGAAVLLDVSRTTIRYHLRRAGLKVSTSKVAVFAQEAS